MIDNASRVQFMYCERGERAKGRERRTGGGGNKVRYITGEKRHLLVKTERRGRERKYDLHVGIVNLTKVRAHTLRSRARVRRTHTRTCSHAPAHANKHARARTHACIPHTHIHAHKHRQARNESIGRLANFANSGRWDRKSEMAIGAREIGAGFSLILDFCRCPAGRPCSAIQGGGVGVKEDPRKSSRRAEEGRFLKE